MESAVDFDEIDSVVDRIRPGEQVRFATLRMARTTRSQEIANGLGHPSGLKRGDVVIFQESQDAKKEIKRLVGFANERIAIEGGDVFVNQERWSKTLQQSLRQSILLNAWERGRPHGSWTIGGEPFQGVLSSSSGEKDSTETFSKLLYEPSLHGIIQNQIAINAHDSHVVLPVQDYGLAMQLSHPENAWKIECELNSPFNRPRVSVELDDGSVVIKTDELVAQAELIQGKDKSVWIVIAMVDGYLIAGSQDEEWLRVKLPLLHANLAQVESGASSPVEIRSVSGRLAIDQMLVFRDIYYRGNGDSEAQIWPESDRIVVLGDNVSASSDSRDRWPEGLPTNSVKGVVLQTESPMEVLLRQR